MPTPSHWSLSVLAALATLGSAEASADDSVAITVHDDDDPAPAPVPATTTTVTHEHEHESRRRTTWFGLPMGAVATPLGQDGRMRPGQRVTSDRFRACLDPFGERYCSAMRGVDVRLQFYRTKDAWDYPRVIGYFRSGYNAGRAEFDAHGAGGYQRGDARSLSYYSVPLFFGGSLYAFKKFPVRPFVGAGVGFDVLKLRYRRHEDRALLDVSARIGFELHAGIEARISNVVALTAEVQQLWSARRRIAGVPDFSNQGLTVMAGVTISIPSRDGWKRHHHVHRVTTTTTRPTAPVAAPAPVIVAPAPASV
ncbi:MAG: hypothetical protein H7138_18345, partial [Myxococcales bacterium]|nr:hypothetical protein [Myxococcales bacterium]